MSPPFEPLLSERLRLRRFSRDDLEPFLAYRSNPDVAKYQGWDPYTREDAMGFLDKQRDSQPGQLGEGAQIAIELKATGEMIGDVFLDTPSGEPSLARIGYTIAPTHQRQGYATEAVTTLLGHVFGPLDKRRVTALTCADNLPSVALLERVGMRREAHYIQSTLVDDHWADEYLYALLQREWSS